MDCTVKNRHTAITVKKYRTAFRSSVPPSMAFNLAVKSKALSTFVTAFPAEEIIAVIEDIIYPTNSTAKLNTAAITWLSVIEETNSPTARQVSPNR